MKSENNKLFDETAKLNAYTFNDYYNRMKLLAMSVFKWENLPESCSERFLEMALFDYGKAVFCNDDILGILSLTCTPSAELNIYNDPVKYTAYSTNYSKEYNLSDIVLVRNNNLMLPTAWTVELFAYRIAKTERSIDVNVNAQKTPVLINCDERERLTLKNIYQKFDGNTPVIFGKKGIDLTNFEVLKTEAPFVADKLEDYKKTVWNEFLTFIGINNSSIDKKERLIADEVNSNNQAISLSAQTMLLTRQKACEDFNKLFGGNISVKLRTPEELGLLENFNEPEEPEESEVE